MAASEMTPGDRIRSAVRRSRQFSAASLVLAVVALVASNTLVAIGACGGWLLALIAVVFARVAVRRARRTLIEDSAPVSRAVPSAGAMLCVALLVGQTLIVGVTMVRDGRALSANSSSAANLRGIGMAVAAYADEFKTYPPTFHDLLLSGGVNPKALLSPLDPGPGWTETSKPEVMHVQSSYIYVPGHGARANDPRIIILYERMPFGLNGLLVSQRPLRCVLFDDGHVETLDEDAFQRAWQQDRQRRRELGWPIPANEPARPPASQPGPVLTWPPW